MRIDILFSLHCDRLVATSSKWYYENQITIILIAHRLWIPQSLTFLSVQSQNFYSLPAAN